MTLFEHLDHEELPAFFVNVDLFEVSAYHLEVGLSHLQSGATRNADQLSGKSPHFDTAVPFELVAYLEIFGG
jgi:hypothetical protein